jgi:hypothetical protein
MTVFEAEEQSELEFEEHLGDPDEENKKFRKAKSRALS